MLRLLEVAAGLLDNTGLFLFSSLEKKKIAVFTVSFIRKSLWPVHLSSLDDRRPRKNTHLEITLNKTLGAS